MRARETRSSSLVPLNKTSNSRPVRIRNNTPLSRLNTTTKKEKTKMALIVIICHDTDHGLEVSGVWDTPIEQKHLQSKELMDKHLTQAQLAALTMLHAMETFVPPEKKPTIVTKEKPKLITKLDTSTIEDFEDGRV
jgi:hypothetical protein